MEIADMIEKARNVMSEYFNNKFDDDQLVGLMELVLDEINAITPFTQFKLCQLPNHVWASAVIVGLKFYLLLSLQETLSMKDFSYSDNGLSLNLDRVSKLETPIKTLRSLFEKMAWNCKKPYIFKMGPKTMSYPRYQGSVCISGFMRILYGVNWQA